MAPWGLGVRVKMRHMKWNQAGWWWLVRGCTLVLGTVGAALAQDRVALPALAIETMPGPSCRRRGENSSSNS